MGLALLALGINLNIITTKEQLKEMVAYYLTQDSFAFDVETVGEHRGIPAVNEVLWISFATYGRGDVIPMGHPNGEFLDEVFPFTPAGEKRVAKGKEPTEADYSKDKKKAIKTFGPAPKQLHAGEVFKALEPLMFNDSKLTIGHNLAFDLSSVAKYYGGRVPTGPYFDTLMATFLYDTRNKGKLGLDDCLQRELGFSMQKGIGYQVEIYSFDEVAKYSYLDSKYTFLLWKALIPKLAASDADNVMELEMGVLRVLCSMKLTGAPMDLNHLSEVHAELNAELELVTGKIYSLAGKVFNINSNNEKQQLLYSSVEEGGRGLTPVIMTKAGAERGGGTYKDYAVSSEALEPYREEDELVGALLEYADLNKLLSTYVIPYLGGDIVKTTNGKTKVEVKESMLINGRIYGDFVQWGAETGRFSSRNPNLQNIPNPRTARGKAIRNLFAAPEGYKLVVADYSQIEPRVLASMSKDPVLMSTYLEGGVGDIYTTIGNTMNIDRTAGKQLVLSLMYGVGPDKIAKTIGCTVPEAKDLLKRFTDQFPAVSEYRAKVLGVTRNKGYVATILKRRRYLPDITSNQTGFRAGAERQAFNTRIQGTAADIIKLAMIRAHESIPKEAKLILTVHDELVTLVPDAFVEDTRDAIREAMEGINLLDIPLIADIKVVQKWGDAK